ncbi:protein kinase [bacterium]|nr:protein kinase [bacterium]
MKSESYERKSSEREKLAPAFLEKEVESTRLMVSGGSESVASAEQANDEKVEKVEEVEKLEKSEESEKIQAFLDSLRSSAGATKPQPVEESADTEESPTVDRADSQLPDWCRALEDVPVSPMGTAQSWIEWFRGFLAPATVIGTIAMMPKLVLLWVLATILKPTFLWFYLRCPLHIQTAIKSQIPESVRQSAFRRDLSEGVDQTLPFVLFSSYIWCLPFSFFWIFFHWLKGFFPEKVAEVAGEEGFSLLQNRRSELSHPENNFYHSRAFGITLLSIFALGIPAIITTSLYFGLGVDKMVLSSRALPVSYADIRRRNTPPPPKPVRYWILKAEQRSAIDRKDYESYFHPSIRYYQDKGSMLTGDGSKPASTEKIFLFFYLYGLAAALVAVLIRAWFVFPLNFLSREHTVECTVNGVRRRGKDDWLFNVLTINQFATGGGPDSLRWSEIKRVRHLEEGFTRLYPLPDNAFSKDSLTYKCLNKIAKFMDGLCRQVNVGDDLVLSSVDRGLDGGRNIKIDLNNLSTEEKARLFYCIRMWAPHVIIDEDVQEKLLGSRVLQDVRYTQLWFDILTEKRQPEGGKGGLDPKDSLKDGQYEIERRLHAGGQATTYVARKPDGSPCVLKEYILASAGDTTTDASGALLESAREFETEVSLLSQLNHGGIVSLYDFFCEQGRVYAVLEYIQGETLKAKVAREGPLSEVEARRIGARVCEILEYLHSLTPAMVHRDVTPENIMITGDGAVKLIDFSLAARADGTQTMESCGKQSYTPPEQFRNEVDPRSDIYALGATLYFMLTGSDPRPISVSAPRALAPDLSESIDAIVQQATALDMKDRYDSVGWMKLELEPEPELANSEEVD